MRSTAFYCVADSAHFVGAAALINSLRLTGHEEPVIVLDCGLEPFERDLLAPHAILVRAPAVRAPSLAKFIAPLERPAAVMVSLDVDLVLVRSLAPLMDTAASGRIVAFADVVPGRFHPAWAEAVGVPELEARTYVNSGFLVLPRSRGIEVLGRVRDLQNSLDLSRSRLRGAEASHADPFFLPDQDAWNAVLMALVPADRMAILPRALAPHPPFPGVRLMDPETLRCEYEDGSRPYALHQWGKKPWLSRTHPTIYTRLLPRLLLRDDVPIRLEPAHLPVRLRGGALALGDHAMFAARCRARGALRRLGLQE